ncbi:hypothetical protein RQP46_003542 [Phenoliferia psychrophenolica]
MSSPHTIKDGEVVLITGATAPAQQSAIKHVYITGRRQALLDDISAKYPNVTGICFDPSDLAAIPALCRKAVIELGVTLIMLNAVDLSVVHAEFTLNFYAPVHFIKELLPLFKAINKPASIVVTTSGLAFAPMARMPSYCASKAAMRSFLLSVRRQLEDEGDKNHTAIIELAPPLVQTELHDPKHQPDFEGVVMKYAGVPGDVYCQDAFERLVRGGEDEIMYGTSIDFLTKVGTHQRGFVNAMPVRNVKNA